MATQSIAPVAASATSTAACTSLILELHARYEQSLADTNKVDSANSNLSRDGDELILSFRFEDSMKVMLAEREALVRAILYQVPTTDEELAILAMHLWALYDPDADDIPAADLNAIASGLDNLFVYLVSEGRAVMEKVGPSFSRDAMLARHRVRARQGKLDGEA